MATSVSYDCRDCRKPATVIGAGETIACVYCPACGIAVDAGAAVRMHDTLLGRYRLRAARKASGPKGRWLGNGFTDGRWPFVMKVAE